MSAIFQNPSVWWMALGIFFLRVVNVAIDTVRMLSVMRGMRFISFILGVLQSMLFIVALGPVLNDLNNILLILAYAVGFATGGLLGMVIEQRLAFGFVHITVVSSKHGKEIAGHLRKHGHAVTEIDARGKDGQVTMLECNVKRKFMKEVNDLICESDNEAFVTTRDITPLHRGYWLQG